ncbi:HlyD family secretion protein [Falsiruegeria mediterranea]|uniref:Inner membrane protein YibH n=1 Tax=Falsiruegeria mediterranea M17 TaxID=1200281 RepID=A0A2R8C752_9RHOB|nr:biotin/lipoyl-binding protein [Falsiruegeria mediterranea]SPJ28274.1 Inner membrane protein YibH [Falsiruegeria mediterranea M17]
MLETLLCALFTILPDYLFRRYVQGKRIGHEITLFSMWYELRIGLTACAIAAISVITVLFYYHPATSSVASYYRTLTLLPQFGGRVSEIYVKNNQKVKAGDPIFRLDAVSQEASVQAAKAAIAEVDASVSVAQTDLAAAKAGIVQANAALTQSNEDLARNQTLLEQGSSAVKLTEIERLQNLVDERVALVDAAEAQLAAVEQRISVVIPAQRDSAEAQLAQAQAELDKTLIVAGVDGTIEQLSLQVGDFVNPILRPAGILVPDSTGHKRFQAAFNQMAAQVAKPGMVAEIGCMTQPFTVYPMVVVAVQDVIPSGQVRPSDRIFDPQNNPVPGSIMVFLEPLYSDNAPDLPPGSNCLANLYTNNHERLEHDEDLGTGERIFLHVVDTIGVVHAAGLRLRMILMPVQTLVFSGGH